MSTIIWNVVIDEVNQVLKDDSEVAEVKTELYALLAQLPRETMLDLEQAITAYADAHTRAAFLMGLEAGHNPVALILPSEVSHNYL